MCEQYKVNAIFEELCRTLSLNSEVDAISQKFSALNTNVERVSFASELLEKHSLFPKLVQETKHDDVSSKYRQEGNEGYKKKNSFMAWNMYTKSIAHATNSNECLALAYANRSAVLYEKQLYKQCLEDITNAFKNNYPKQLHEKLIQREGKARELLSSQQTKKYHERVHNIKTVNKKIQCASTSVEIRNSKDLGRHVVALKKIKLGEVISVEKPYAKVLLKDCMQDHCYSCFELCYNLIPCDHCVYAMYCSKECQESAWKQYHKHECPILATLFSLDVPKLGLLALRISILSKEEYGKLHTYKFENYLYKSQSYEEIHFLEANTHLRKSSDLFPRAITAAIISNLIKTHTSFFLDFENCKKEEDIFNELIMLHLQTGPTNFHEISESSEDSKGVFTTQEIGGGAYAFLSLLNHSCTPNVVRHCHGSDIILRAIKPIPKNGQLLDNYGYHHAVMSKGDRQRELQRQYFFKCSCDACENNWPLYNTLSHKGKFVDIPSSKLDALKRGDRDEAVAVLAVLLNSYEDLTPSRPNRFTADIQEIIKQCYALLGNRKPKF